MSAAIGIRQMLVQDQAVTLYGPDYGVTIVMIGPDGLDYSTDINGNPVAGRLVYDHVEVNEDGIAMIIKNPCITLPTSILRRVPKANERWEFKIPLDITNISVKTSFFLDVDRPPQGGDSMAIKRYNLMLGIQS